MIYLSYAIPITVGFCLMEGHFKGKEDIVSTLVVLAWLRVLIDDQREIIVTSILIACRVTTYVFAIYLLIRTLSLMYHPPNKDSDRAWRKLFFATLFMLVYCVGTFFLE